MIFGGLLGFLQSPPSPGKVPKFCLPENILAYTLVYCLFLVSYFCRTPTKKKKKDGDMSDDGDLPFDDFPPFVEEPVVVEPPPKEIIPVPVVAAEVDDADIPLSELKPRKPKMKYNTPKRPKPNK